MRVHNFTDDETQYRTQQMCVWRCLEFIKNRGNTFVPHTIVGGGLGVIIEKANISP